MSAKDGMNYVAESSVKKMACEPGELVFAAVGLDHGHIYGMSQGILESGGTLKWVYDPESSRVKQFQEHFPQVRVARTLEEVLDDPEVKLVNSAAIPCDRGPLGVKVMQAGKDYFTDKAPFTTLEQIADARKASAETGRKYMVSFSERIHNEASVLAEKLIKDGAIGKVVGLQGFGPHRHGASRPDWFYRKAQYGGILVDLASHQCDQFFAYTGAREARVISARVANVRFKQFPELEDYGEALIEGDNGSSMYIRVDWLTPDALPAWGDGRMLIIGTEGYLELRKYIDLGTMKLEPTVFLVNQKEHREFKPKGTMGFPFFPALIRDILDRTENAMTQEHAFKASELAVQIQVAADTLGMRQG